MSFHRLLKCKTLQALSCRQTQRSFSTNTAGEIRITKILKEKFPQALSLKVVDISGGCGAMYEIHIESDEFRGKRTVKQHQLVNEALKEEIKEMHGLRIFTEVPKK
ncbi:bolA-like protein 3 [Ictalurus punctatus]|uniref:BolA-like protein 3 n=1 Tax=Ictalurus punctatus TaxID=7998 RepID=A0A2D0RVE7_ICTPU|nr:bolA-like protein 3 [Ictalurus punctatus]